MSETINKDHTFVICAYKESPFLRNCIESIKRQSVHSKIVCTTSTPNSLIADVCAEYGIELYINPEQKGLAADWNFAYSQTDTAYVTIAHQDDVYEPDFLKFTLDFLTKVKRPLIAFTGCYEIRDDSKVTSNRLLKIKRIMSTPWRVKTFSKSRFLARRIFMFGNPICCPSVTLVRKNLTEDKPLFNTGYDNNCDWLTWIEIRNLPGSFVYCPKILMGHRIHSESETTNRIGDNTRSIEDLLIMQSLAPKPIAKLIHRFYVKGQSSNKI
jgi:glycosyltransferase involved in cell wall biosynthesis